MKLNFNRKTVALVLFGAAIFLLIANLTLIVFEPKTKRNSEEIKISDNEIDSLFHLSLSSFGIRESWIKENRKIKNIKSYRVKVPLDLSIPVILAELNSNFWDTHVIFNTVEKEFSGKTILEINFNERVRLKAEFDYDDNINRSGGSMAFVLENFELSSNIDSLLLEIPEPFSLLLIPSTKNFELSNYILNKNKTYTLLLNDDISELKYKLRSSYSIDRLKGSLQSIINDFSTATFFVIDDESDLYNSDVFTFIGSELLKRKIRTVKLSNLIRLNSGNQEALTISFDNYLKEVQEDYKPTFLINASDFMNLIPEIKRYTKIGYILVHPSEILLK